MSKVSVLLVTYNQEKYVCNALDSIEMQNYEDIEVVVADDGSTDQTLSIIENFSQKSRFKYIFLDSSRNLGINENYRRALNACKCDYIAILEGDDYWSNPDRISIHINFLNKHRECSMSYNRLVLLWEKNNKFELLPNETGDVYDFISSHSLASGKCIGNLSACVIRQSLVSFIPPSLFDVCFDDWSLGLSLGLYGLIAKLNEPMSIYRKRKMGYWSGLSDLEQKQKILYRIDKYDLIFSGIYVDEFFLLRKSLMNKEEKNEKIEISRRKIMGLC